MVAAGRVASRGAGSTSRSGPRRRRARRPGWLRLRASRCRSSTQWPSASRTASSPLPGLGSSVSADRAPGEAVVLRFGDADAIERRRSRACRRRGCRRSAAARWAGCCRSRSAACWRTRSPAVVAEGHDRDRERVGVERQDDPAGGQDRRLAPRRPSRAAGRADRPASLFCASRGRRRRLGAA